MKFAKLRLSGFKSFVEPVELHIRDGLTGVVGPNGCGKSNLLEALRWVMGENSARSLRVAAGGAGMEDVIFAGTARRPSRDHAEVRLTLDNSKRLAPIEYNKEDELEIARAIKRGDGSAYSLNGRDIRLKDVQLLFADAATGAHSPALVSQGRVAAIISAKPQERRQLLEEAAGISGLNVRRREAEQRLRAADANLLRLDDVMKGSESQANALRRQARAAAKYRDLSNRIRDAEAASLKLQWIAAVEASQEADRELQTIDELLKDASKTLEAATLAQVSVSRALPSKRQEQANAAAQVQELQTRRASLLSERASIGLRIQDLERAIENARSDLERERLRAVEAVDRQARLTEDLAAQQLAHQEYSAAIQPHAEAAKVAEAEASDAERLLAKAVEAHAALMADARSVRAQAEAAKSRHDRLVVERQRLEAEMERLKASSSTTLLADQIRETEAILAARTAEAEAAGAAIAQAEREAQAAKQASEAVEKALSAARSEVASLEAEAAALERLRTNKHAVVTRSARSELTVKPGYEAAAAVALGDDLSAGLGKPEKPSRHWLGLDVQPSDAPLPAYAKPLSEFISVPGELARRVAQIGLVEQAPSQADLAALSTGQCLVSKDGWMWRWDGLICPPGGQATAVAEALAQDNRRKEIAAALIEPRERRAAAEAELAQQKTLLAEAQAAERFARTKRAEAERAREQIGARLQGLRSSHAQAVARTSAIEASIERLLAETEGAKADWDGAQSAVERLPDSTLAAQKVGDARQLAERTRILLAQCRAQAATVARNADDALAAVQRLTTEIAEWQQRCHGAQSVIQALTARLEQMQGEHAHMVAEPEALDARLAAIEDDMAKAEARRQLAQELVIAAELEVTELEGATKAANTAVSDLREDRATRAAKSGQMRERVANLVAVSSERFGANPMQLEMPEGATPDHLERALQQMRAERERIGVVNLRADIELAEIEATLAEQNRERSELETAINRLRGSIGTLNREGRTRLLDAFQKVQGNFRELFVTLFGGGSAELLMVDSDDPLESGLEIRAQPPGKKLQMLSLLSGGEQALTAIALIFALFRTNPAPICVLDEVDAPLDDANVERFTRLLQHMSDTTDTRFLIVTHNPVTMAAMHRLYGVTMAEPGVSQLVSVELREAQQMVAA